MDPYVGQLLTSCKWVIKARLIQAKPFEETAGGITVKEKEARNRKILTLNTDTYSCRSLEQSQAIHDF